MTFASEIAEALSEIREEFGGAITYRRGEQWVTLSPVGKGETTFRFTDAYGVSQRVITADWLIPDSLLFRFTVPQIGDRVSEVIGQMRYIYELVSINNELCWKHTDVGKTQVCVHTMLVDTVPI